MPSQQPKRYSIKTMVKGRAEIEYYVDKYIHALTVARMLSEFGQNVIVYDNKTNRIMEEFNS